MDSSTDTRVGESSQTDDTPTSTSNLPRRSGRVIRPTWKVIESRLEPPTVHVETPPAPDRRVVLLVREKFHGARNEFGLSRTYKGVPSSIPDHPNSSTYIPSYQHPTTPRELRTIDNIIQKELTRCPHQLCTCLFDRDWGSRFVACSRHGGHWMYLHFAPFNWTVLMTYRYI